MATVPETLLEHTLRDLEQRCAPGVAEYDMLMASALIRKLLFDKAPLLAQANRAHRLKIVFQVADDADFSQRRADPGVFGWIVGDGLDPDEAPNRAHTLQLNLNAFLAHTVGQFGETPISVKGVASLVANSMGGVHYKPPKDDEEIRLFAAAQHWTRMVSVIPAFLPAPRNPIQFVGSTLFAIGRVIVKAAQPLRESIRTGAGS